MLHEKTFVLLILGQPVKAGTVCYVLVSVLSFGNRVLPAQWNVGIFQLYWPIRARVVSQYLLLTEFKVRTVSYGPSFFRGSVTYSTVREDEVRKIFIISLLCLWRVRKRFLLTWTGLKSLSHVESKTSQFAIVVKSLARFNSHFKVKERFKLLLAIKFRNTWR